MYKIDLEDLVANAFITLSLNNIEKKELSYSILERYGRKVIEKLKDEFNEEGYLNLSRINTDEFYYNFSMYFTECNNGVHLKEDITRKELINKFRGYLGINLLLAFEDKEIIEFLKGEIVE